MIEKEAKRSYVNYSKPAPQVVKPSPAPIEDVAVKAEESAPAEITNTEETTPVVEVSNPVFDRADDIAEVVNVKKVNVASLNVRRSPDLDAPNVVDQLKLGAKVNIIEEVGEFSKIGEGRYVVSKFLS